MIFCSLFFTYKKMYYMNIMIFWQLVHTYRFFQLSSWWPDYVFWSLFFYRWQYSILHSLLYYNNLFWKKGKLFYLSRSRVFILMITEGKGFSTNTGRTIEDTIRSSVTNYWIRDFASCDRDEPAVTVSTRGRKKIKRQWKTIRDKLKRNFPILLGHDKGIRKPRLSKTCGSPRNSPFSVLCV